VRISLEVETRRYPIAGAFTISRGSQTEAEVIEVRLSAEGRTGHGECVPYDRYGESIESVVGLVEGLRGDLLEGLGRDALQGRLPPGAARNAVDCALWDLESKLAGRRAWQLAGLGAPGPLVTAYTLSLDTPEAMRARAEANAHRPLLKIKLGDEGDLERLRAVRAGAPEARLVVDANEGWDAAAFGRIMPELADLGVEMVEQPLPAADDAALAGLARTIPVCADESCHTRADLPALAGKYDMVNIKLDKTGGLTEALALRDAARAAGFRIMVGCMIGSSLAMAPGVLVAQGADVVDLDAPLLLAEDREPGLVYDGDGVHPPEAALWG
jgi:L-alanine-DL-glutamate epimerase-like enolase superfamily enzyme